MDVGSWVPHFFYDLIGRIVPGLILMASGAATLFPRHVLRDGVVFLDSSGGTVGTLVILGAILFSYAVGALLGGMGAVVTKQFWLRRTDRRDCSASLQNEDAYRYDAILFHAPMAGARLAKVRAEMHMAQSLCRGFVLLAVLVFAVGLQRETGVSTVAVGLTLLALALLSFILARSLGQTFVCALLNMWCVREAHQEWQAKKGN